MPVQNQPKKSNWVYPQLSVSEDDLAQTSPEILAALKSIKLPQKDSHKGQNGKLLLIGGSELFHAASKWSLDVASKFIDMVFYSSVPENNEVMQSAKEVFWNGIVIERSNIPDYIDEADAILIGPGMMRNDDTESLTNQLLTTYPNKKWVVDAGALQMVNPSLLHQTTIITPHPKELAVLEEKDPDFSREKHAVPQLITGHSDIIKIGDTTYTIEGGNPGMTKGGTGDVLAGLVTALYCQHDAQTAMIAASFLNKKAGDFLYESVGPFFNSSDLVQAIPPVAWAWVRAAQKL